MDREFLISFPQLDPKEVNKVLMVAIETSSIIQDDRFRTNLTKLAESDENLKIRNAAMKTLKNTYDRII